MHKEQARHPYILARPEVTMDFATLALIALVGIVGPLLALPERLHLPVVLGELGAGIVLGETGLRVLHADDSTFTFLADIGFALVMFVAGSQVPVRDWRLRAGLATGARRAVAVGVVATALGVVIAGRARNFALELRVNLAILFALAALAVRTHVSIMLAGFSFGLAMAAVGEPRRLARQRVTEGHFGPAGW
jgi:Kef-type K+ transport system membrane component KefB